MAGGLACDDLLRDGDSVVDGDGEPNARIVARVGSDQRVDADDLAVLIDKRTAGITGVMDEPPCELPL